MLMKPDQFEIDGSALHGPSNARPGFFTRLIMRLEAYAQHRAQRRQLMALDDHLLKDIGLSRAEATRISTESFSWRGANDTMHRP